MMEEKLLRSSRSLLELATGLWPPSNITVAWNDNLPRGVSARYLPLRRLIKLNRLSSTASRNPERVLVHELAHATHWEATRFAHVCGPEIEQFAVCATLLVDVMRYGKIASRYAASRKEDRIYYEAERWFERHTAQQVRAWMQYLLCF